MRLVQIKAEYKYIIKVKESARGIYVLNISNQNVSV